MSAAARTLDVTQPTVGRRMAAFEQSLGARLFVQSPAGQLLSTTGKRLVAHAERIEAEALSIARSASGRDAGVRGLVRITASEWVVDRLLSSLIGPLLAMHPDLELELTAEPRHLNLVRHEAEIAIRPSRFVHQDIVESSVAVVSFGLYASEAYLARSGMPDFGRQCEDHTLVAMSASLAQIPDVDWLPRVASKARVVARANARIPMATMAAAGVGLAVLPCFLGNSIPTLRLLCTPTPGPERQLWLAAHRDTRAIPRVARTFEFLRERIRRLRPLLRPPIESPPTLATSTPGSRHERGTRKRKSP